MTTTLKRPRRLAGKPTRASQRLDRILSEARLPTSDVQIRRVAAAIRGAIIRDQLWRFRSGKRRPELESMDQLEKLTAPLGREQITIRMWLEPARS